MTNNSISEIIILRAWCGSQSSCIAYNAYSEYLCLNNNCQGLATKAACDAQQGDNSNFDCGWCPNSYNGGTSANGGTCMKAQNLAANCGGNHEIRG